MTAAKSQRFGRTGWTVGAAALVLLGVVGSVFAARAVAHNDARTSQHAQAASSADVLSHLQLALQHEEDLVVGARAFIVTTPNASNAQLNEWLTAEQAFKRYPEMGGLARLVLVSAADLPAFAARARLDPVGTLGPKGALYVVPPGKRAFYCFIEATSKSPIPVAPLPAGVDYCATNGYGAGLLSARDSGRGAYLPYKSGKSTLLIIYTPIYMAGVVPATVAERRAAFIGWIGVGLRPAVVMDRAIEGQPQMAVSLVYGKGSSVDAFRAGVITPGATMR
ncbi:MAG: CHASE domain-containing protein, partial [Solirubrobacteraceae bacterium]